MAFDVRNQCEIPRSLDRGRQLPLMPGSPSPHTWTFPRNAPPLAAAEVVADKLREYGFAISDGAKSAL